MLLARRVTRASAILPYDSRVVICDRGTFPRCVGDSENFSKIYQKNPVKELEAVEGRDAHVEEHSVEHRHRDVAQDRRHQGGHADRQEDQDVGHALFPGSSIVKARSE